MKRNVIFYEKKRWDTNLMKRNGSINDCRWESNKGIFTESNAPRIYMKVVTKYSLLLKDSYIYPIKLARQSMMYLPRLKALRLSGRIWLDSNHQWTVKSVFENVFDQFTQSGRYTNCTKSVSELSETGLPHKKSKRPVLY